MVLHIGLFILISVPLTMIRMDYLVEIDENDYAIVIEEEVE
jgi:hypothetical protein